MRPTFLTPEKQKIILDSVRAGNWLGTSFLRAGLSVKDLEYWKKRAEENVEPYADFVRKLNEAQAEMEATMLSDIRRGAPNAKWVAWILERRFPKRWSYRINVQAGERVQELLQALQERVKPETFAEIVAAVESAEHAQTHH